MNPTRTSHKLEELYLSGSRNVAAIQCTLYTVHDTQRRAFWMTGGSTSMLSLSVLLADIHQKKRIAERVGTVTGGLPKTTLLVQVSYSTVSK